MKRTLLLILLVTIGCAVRAQVAQLAHGPYLQQVTDDGFTVVWTTTHDAVAWIEIAPDDGSHFYAADRPRYYDAHIGRLRTGRLHRARVEGLEPGTTYRYRIMQQTVVAPDGSEPVLGAATGTDIYLQPAYTATTLDPRKERTEFWVVNDIHARDSVLRLLLEDAAAEKPDFICFNGDMTSWMISDEQLFEGYLATASELLTPAGIPIFFVRGNHENRGGYAHAFLDYFPTPTGQTYYTFRQGPVFFLVLDGCEDKPDSDFPYGGFMDSDAFRQKEARWLEGVVASEAFRTAPYRIVLEHMLPAGEGSWYGEQQISRLFLPLLRGAGIDLMLSGHYHQYAYIDDGSRGTDFPILVNSNRDKLVVAADKSGIDVRVVDTSGRTIHEHRIAPSRRSTH